MATTAHDTREKLPGRFEDLVAMMPPRAMRTDAELEEALDTIDRLMACGRLTKGQEIYLETLVQLAMAYESSHHAVDTSDLNAMDSLTHLLAEHGMNASDLARLLEVHPSMGSKILKGDRSLTVGHLKKLAAYFKVGPELFID
jgi:HTH-type transcriptional regulator / antitoxin HigA